MTGPVEIHLKKDHSVRPDVARMLLAKQKDENTYMAPKVETVNNAKYN